MLSYGHTTFVAACDLISSTGKGGRNYLRALPVAQLSMLDVLIGKKLNPKKGQAILTYGASVLVDENVLQWGRYPGWMNDSEARLVCSADYDGISKMQAAADRPTPPIRFAICGVEKKGYYTNFKVGGSLAFEDVLKGARFSSMFQDQDSYTVALYGAMTELLVLSNPLDMKTQRSMSGLQWFRFLSPDEIAVMTGAVELQVSCETTEEAPVAHTNGDGPAADKKPAATPKSKEKPKPKTAFGKANEANDKE